MTRYVISTYVPKDDKFYELKLYFKTLDEAIAYEEQAGNGYQNIERVGSDA